MPGRGEYQKQLAALVAAAKANDLEFEDILPDETLGHFQEMTELKTAREYIKELEDREKKLQVTNGTLTNDLNEKRMEIDNLPAEHQALKVDLQQAQRQIILYKKTSEDAQERVQRYRRQLDEIVDKQQADASTADKIEDLQNQIEDQQAVINKLMDDNRKSEAMFEQLRESNTKALERKDKQLAKKKKELAEKDELLAELHKQDQETNNVKTALRDTDSLLFDDTDDTKTLVDDLQDDPLLVQQENIDLLQRNLALAEHNRALEDQNTALQSQLCQMAQLHQMSLSCESASAKDREAQLFADAVPETKPLNRFYKVFREVLGVFAKIFKASSKDKILSLSDLGIKLDAAHDALDDYFVAKNVVRASTEASGHDDTGQIALRKELDSMAASAADSIISLETLYTGLWGFLHQVSDDPKMLSDLNGALCDAGRVHVIDLDSCD